MSKDKFEKVDFVIKCSMRRRWIPHFLGMLRYMQHLGNWGSSREVTIYSDGDGDFRPKFEWDDSLPENGEPIKDDDGHRVYDAG